MNLSFPRHALILLPLIAAGLIACGKDAFIPEKDFGAPDAMAGLVWKCHTVFSLEPDSAGRTVLDIAGYDADYPGMEWPWLRGDWSGYRRLCFQGRVLRPASMDFGLTLWDGKGRYAPGNRHLESFTLTHEWKRFCLDLGSGLSTPAGKTLSLKHVERVVLYTSGALPPVRFQLADVRLLSDMEP